MITATTNSNSNKENIDNNDCAVAQLLLQSGNTAPWNNTRTFCCAGFVFIHACTLPCIFIGKVEKISQCSQYNCNNNTVVVLLQNNNTQALVHFLQIKKRHKTAPPTIESVPVPTCCCFPNNDTLYKYVLDQNFSLKPSAFLD